MQENDHKIKTANKALEWSRVSSVSIVTRLRTGSIPGRGFFCHRVHTGSRVHPTSYPIGTEGSFPGEKTAVA
jgi:hypothetical protein